MPRTLLPCVFFLAVFARSLCGHAPPIGIPLPPFRVEGNRLVDSGKIPFLLRGVNLPGLETGATEAMTQFTFRVIQQRWNMNAVRLPVSPALWRRDGAAYLDTVVSAVTKANAEGLVVILAAYESAPLPTAATLDFWRAAATKFRDNPRMIFGLFHEPSSNAGPANRWQVWQNSMQPLVDAIRATGAAQIISVSTFHDNLDFQGFTAANAIRDPNILYEVHPYFDHGLTDESRDANFGFVTANYPVYAGAWGMPFGQDSPACRAVPQDTGQAADLLFQTMAYFNSRSISWTVSDFRPGSLIRNLTDATATQLDGPFTCDAASNPRVGIGQHVLTVMTGDLYGFGSIDSNLIASAAGYTVGPVAPGQLIAIFGQQVGPTEPASAGFDEAGRTPTILADTQVLFNGIPAAILFASAFQTNVQVPNELADLSRTTVQLIYRGVPSNIVELALTPAAPGIFTLLGTNDAAALNQDTTVNSRSNPADRGAIVAFFATGCGAFKGIANVTVTIAGRPAEVFYFDDAPGLVGVTQINVRVPADLPVASTAAASVVLNVVGTASRSGVTFWVK